MYVFAVKIFSFLYVLIPLGILSYRWKTDLSWWKLSLVCSVLSWVFFNMLVHFAPPVHPLAYLTTCITGWFWMLPLLMLLAFGDWLLFKIFLKIREPELRKQIGSKMLIALSYVSGFCFFGGVFAMFVRWMRIKFLWY
jgi:hypothetical protein